MYQKSLATHTDMNPWYMQYPVYQGSICLEDCPVGNGGFTVMPGTNFFLFWKFDFWIRSDF